VLNVAILHHPGYCPPASWVESILLEHGLLAAAIVVGVLATLAGTVCWLGHLRGIRRDLETGRGAM
jgi:hypothetical protein